MNAKTMSSFCREESAAVLRRNGRGMSAQASLEKIQSALSYISPEDRDTWWRVGMAIKAELGDAGRWVWDDWSQGTENYNERAASAVWRSFKSGGKVQIGTVFYLAKEKGWTWGKPERKLSAEEVEAIRASSRKRAEEEAAKKLAEQEQAALHAAAIWNSAANASTHPYLTRKGVAAHGLKVSKWEVIDSETGEVRVITPNALLVPIKDRTGKLWSLQAIYPHKSGDRDKDYLKGGAKAGHFHAIGKPVKADGRLVFIITEGYATGASVHAATGHCVLVCFDSGNLLPVAAAVRDRQADAIILLAADNDQFKRRKDGTAYNAGVDAATKAAQVVGGHLAVPQFAELDEEPTDWNDLARLEGTEVVAEQIAAALEAAPYSAMPASARPTTAAIPGPGPSKDVIQGTHGDYGHAAASATDPVESVADSIKSRLANVLGIDQADNDAVRTFGIDTCVIARMIRGAFWSGSKSKLFLLNDSQNLNQFQAGEAYKFLVRTFGSPVDAQAIADLTEEAISAQGLNKTQEKALRRAVTEVAGTVVLDHLKHHNQRESVEWRCDMFAEEATMHLLEDKARVVLAHKPFEVLGSYEQAIVDDYKQHFTRLDDFLKFLVQSRFALDRKKCYLWILADSDWGKGFLLGVLNSLRISVSTSMKEIEAMFEGRPVGRAPEDFKRAIVLVVDEFKTVKSELKQLQSEITLSPKNQLTASVEVFAKLFLSAESVASLVTENGVDDQFANRMSIFEESGSLVNRHLYVEVGNPRYFASVLAYSAETMNRMVAEMQAMGREEAQAHAERWINEFIRRNGIDTLYDRFSASLPDVAADVVRWVHKKHRIARGYLLSEGKDENRQHYLASPSKRLDEYLFEHFDASEVQAYRRRKPEILKSMSGDGKGAYPHTVNGHQVKAVMLKKIGESDHPLHD